MYACFAGVCAYVCMCICVYVCALCSVCTCAGGQESCLASGCMYVSQEYVLMYVCVYVYMYARCAQYVPVHVGEGAA
jgi:hypothetical protein